MLPAINLGSVLASVDTHMNDNRLKHRAHVHERRMHRNMEGFCIYQAYLRRLRSLHRAYVSKYKQLVTQQGQPPTSQPDRYQQHQQQRQQQLQQRQQQQRRHRRDWMADESSARRCSHLKCCHDEQRRKANLLHLRNKFSPGGGVRGPTGERLLHETTPDKGIMAGRPQPASSGQRDSQRIPGGTSPTKRFRMSHSGEIIITNSSNPEPAGDSKTSTSVNFEGFPPCGTDTGDSPLLPPLQSHFNLGGNPGISEIDEDTPTNGISASKLIKSDPSAIRIPCGRDGSFCEADSLPQINLVSLKLGEAPPSNKPVSPLNNDALPFRVWKRHRDLLGGNVHSTDLNTLHRT